jgi:hypothetical protein
VICGLALKVGLTKLKKYCEDHGGYDLFIEGKSVTLSFVPNFPEALEKGDSTPPKVSMIGKIDGENVIFDKVEMEDSSGVRIRDAEESELVYRGWLDFVEQNY